MAAGGTSANVLLGPGRLYYAPLGTTEPTSASAALPSAWQAVGYTEEGTTVSIDISSDDVMVAEEFDPISSPITGRKITLAFTMAETTKKRLSLALAGGAATTDDGTAYEPTDPGSDLAVMFVWDSDETPAATTRRWIFRQCRASGTVEISRKKAPDKATLPVTFNVEKPTTGLRPFRIYPNANGQI